MALPGDCPVKQSSTRDLLREKGAEKKKKRNMRESNMLACGWQKIGLGRNEIVPKLLASWRNFSLNWETWTRRMWWSATRCSKLWFELVPNWCHWQVWTRIWKCIGMMRTCRLQMWRGRWRSSSPTWNRDTAKTKLMSAENYKKKWHLVISTCGEWCCSTTNWIACCNEKSSKYPLWI